MKEIGFTKLTKGFGFISDDFTTNKSPIVALCGWMNGPVRPVKKYASLMSQMGYRVLILQSTALDFFRPGFMIHSGSYQSVKRLLEDEDPEWIPFMMSNGGCKSWYCFSSKFQKPPKTKAMIFDSAPTFFLREPRYEIFVSNVEPAWFQTALVKLVLGPLFFVMRFFIWMNPDGHFIRRHVKRFIHEQKKVPKLFLYSDVDDLVSKNDIENVIRVAREQYSLVHTANFEESEHVAHYAKYPVAYKHAITAFFQDVDDNKIISSTEQ